MGSFGRKEEKPKKDPKEIYGEEIAEFLLNGEEIEDIYPLIFDFLCFTNKRLIICR